MWEFIISPDGLDWVDVVIVVLVSLVVFRGLRDWFLALFVVLPVGLVAWFLRVLLRIAARLSGRPLPPLEPDASLSFLFRGIFGRPRSPRPGGSE